MDACATQKENTLKLLYNIRHIKQCGVVLMISVTIVVGVLLDKYVRLITAILIKHKLYLYK